MKGGEKMDVLTALAGMAPELLAWASVMVIFYIYRKDTKEKAKRLAYKITNLFFKVSNVSLGTLV